MHTPDVVTRYLSRFVCPVERFFTNLGQSQFPLVRQLVCDYVRRNFMPSTRYLLSHLCQDAYLCGDPSVSSNVPINHLIEYDRPVLRVWRDSNNTAARPMLVVDPNPTGLALGSSVRTKTSHILPAPG
ncbi:hypothetical protein CHU98_g11136 [Xylaria longipes]|nr:hypothetical protein CHU98_g11136 [Xylaria longipes]